MTIEPRGFTSMKKRQVPIQVFRTGVNTASLKCQLKPAPQGFLAKGLYNFDNKEHNVMSWPINKFLHIYMPIYC